MPRVNIPVTNVTRAAATPPAQTNGDSAQNHTIAGNDCRVWIEVVSSDAGAQSVTVETPGTVDGLAIGDLVVPVPAGATRLIGPFPAAVYNQPDGSLNVNSSVSTTLKFRAYRLA